MVAQRPCVLIVTIRAGDIERVKRRVSEVAGVTDITYSYLTHKLHVKYEGDERRLYEIQSEIKRIVGEAGAEALGKDEKRPGRPPAAEVGPPGLGAPSPRKKPPAR